MKRLQAISIRARVGALVVAAAVVAAAIGVVLLLQPAPGPAGPGAEAQSRKVSKPRPTPTSGIEVRGGDPFAFERRREREFLRQGSRGLAHILYALSPGGVEASAQRTARFRKVVDRAASHEGVDPKTLEALVFLESAGRPDVIAGPTPESASGLGQILPDTAIDLLGMSVDLDRSKQITAAIARQERRLVAARAQADRLEARGRTEERLDRRRGGGGRHAGGGRPGRKQSAPRHGGRRRSEDVRRGESGKRAGRGEQRSGRREQRAGRGEQRSGRRKRRDPPTVEDARRSARRAEARIGGLYAERRRVDERFDPEAALAGSARYLALAEEEFGREDLALASYHMGIGNLESIIGAYLAPASARGPTDATVAEHGLSYAELYFGSSPTVNSRAYYDLRGLGDDSRHYLFKLEAAREIMRLWRSDRAELERLVELHAAKASAEEVLRPPAETRQFEDPEALRQARAAGELVPIRDAPGRLGYRVDDGELGELAHDLGEPRALYRALRPQALATVVYMARQVRRAGGPKAVLSITSAVRDQRYQELLGQSNAQAAAEYSLHTTGYAFDVSRDLPDARERALVFALERLRALNVVDWVEEPGAFHVTVGERARRLLAG